MESIRVVLDDAAQFDAAVHGTMPECGDLALIAKSNGTVKGAPVVVVTFTVVLPDGTKARAQAVTTLRALVLGVRALAVGHSL